MPANLALGNRSNPTQTNIDRDSDDADDPDDLGVMGAVVAENDGEDDAAEIARGAGASGDDAVGVGVDVCSGFMLARRRHSGGRARKEGEHTGHEGEVSSVAGFEEEGHSRNEAEHRTLIIGVDDANGNEEGAGDEGEGVDQSFLAPHSGSSVQIVGDDASQGSEHDVEETEHGGPVARAGLLELGEVLEVVGAEDGVDGKFGAEGAKVASGGHEGLQREDNGHCLLECWLDDDFAASSVEHLLFADLGFAIIVRTVLAGSTVFDLLLVIVARRAFGPSCG